MTVSPGNYHSWRRFWARMFDYFLIGFLFLLLSRNSIFALNNIFLYSALQLIVVISAEAFMLARTGTTAGKSFLGLRVVSPSAPLDFNLAWKRTFWAYVKGLWLGIPIMMFVPAWFARGYTFYSHTPDLIFSLPIIPQLFLSFSYKRNKNFFFLS